MPNLYIVAGCNGAGKTTASYTVLPEMLNCKEFVNADEIARGLSPFQPENVPIEAGKIMLARIHGLLKLKSDFAFETTLSARHFVKVIEEAQNLGYFVTLIFLWLESKELAIERVKLRVNNGGHGIPKEVIINRYKKGLENLFKLYIPVCDYWMVLDNSINPLKLIAEGLKSAKIEIKEKTTWNIIKMQVYEQ